jgi:hypothetical protein
MWDLRKFGRNTKAKVIANAARTTGFSANVIPRLVHAVTATNGAFLND